MAVRERTYRPYTGTLTERRRRLFIVPRYAYKDVFSSRLLLVAVVSAMVWPAICMLIIYLHHNVEAMAALDVNPLQLLAIDGDFFRLFYRIQGLMGFVIVFLAGPPLISVDLTHNGLPLYLARPFSRSEYLLGKLLALGILLSVISWVPGLLLFGFQSLLEGGGWALENLQLAAAICVAGWVGIIFISLVVLAISAWVRWRALARALFLGMFVFLAIVSGVIRELFRTDWGAVLNPGMMLVEVWRRLFGAPLSVELPGWAPWAVVLVCCLLALVLLERKVQAYEEVG